MILLFASSSRAYSSPALSSPSSSSLLLILENFIWPGALGLHPAYVVAISKQTKASVALEKASSPLKLGTLCFRCSSSGFASRGSRSGTKVGKTIERWKSLSVGICLTSMEEVVDLSVSHETNLSGMELVLYKGDVCAGNSDETEDEPVLVEVSGKELIVNCGGKRNMERAQIQIHAYVEMLVVLDRHGEKAAVELEASLGHGERATVEAVTDLTPGFK
ncbi:hypothetical protein Tco_1078423 [Tanacetum coccineum]|uniref:Uncharacterized protein n=1 Tax=Tanacetum coccineum TaxID=301880 RepID=A0ABQ5HP18_9ASTR